MDARAPTRDAPALLRTLAAGARELDLRGVDEDVLARLAGNHGVDLLLRASGTAFGPDAQATLDRAHRTSLVTTTQALADMAVAGEALDDAGVRWAVVKGPVLAEAVWATPATRPYGDLDLLVDPRRLGTALEALTASGARLLDRDLALLTSLGRSELSMCGRHGSSVDLHWDLLNEPRLRAACRLETVPLLERRRRVDLAGFRGWALDPTDALLHVAAHAVVSGGHRLVWAVDVRESIARGGFTWPTLLARARTTRTDLLLDVALHRTAQTLGLDARWPRRPWTLATRAVGARWPAGRDPQTRPTAISPFLTTSGTTRHSALSLGRLLAGKRHPLLPEPDVQAPHDSPAELRALLEAAARLA